MNLKRALAAVALAAWALTAAALPNVDQVQAEVARGNYAAAEKMMQEVVTARPGSARAHYVFAEILAHNRNFDEAAQQVARARQIDPGLSFADASKFEAFSQLIAREQQAARAGKRALSAPAGAATSMGMAPERASGTPAWIWVLGLAGVAGAIFLFTTRRRMSQGQPSYGMATSGMGPGYGGGYAPGYGPQYGPQGPSGGSGMLGVGLAAAGGLAAGMMVERMLDSHGNPVGAGNAMQGNTGMVPGMFDDEGSARANAAADELVERPVDFGQGDGWGGGSDGGGGDNSGGDGGGW